MNAHSLRVLEFDKVKKMLREKVASSLGEGLIDGLRPDTEVRRIKERQAETSEAVRLFQVVGDIPLGGIHDIRMLVEKAVVSAMLQPQELLDCAHTLASARRLRTFLVKRAEDFPLMAAIGGLIDTFEKTEDEIVRSISQGGEVLDSASQTLARVRSQIRSAHGRLTERLHSIISSSQYKTAIQDPVIVMRDDRYCVPVKSEYRSQIPGIVHDSSASGATIFVEPAQVVELGNDLKQFSIKEREEIEKVLRELTALIATNADAIRGTLEVLARIDFIAAKAKLSISQDAVEPELNTNGYLELRKARHPLLGNDAVPIDVVLGKRYRTLLITGPNTGGKTVTLKTIGLLTLMAQSGMHVPAAIGTQVAVFDGIHADIGDEQSIEQSLSTFSSHIRNIVRVVTGLVPNSLVLLDEVGAGTDPAEGAALAKSILSFLLDRDARTVATTHYGELKQFAYVREGIENSSVEFDPVSLKPTYRLLIGVPGSSNAFHIALRLGMPKIIIKAAEEAMSGERDSSEEIIKKIEESHRAVLEEKREAEIASEDAGKLKARYEEQLRKVEAARDKVEAQVRREAEQVLNKYKKQLDRALEQLARQKTENQRTQQIKQQINKSLQAIDERLVEEDIEVEIPVDTSKLKPGDRVKVANMSQEGVIGEIADGQAMVMVGTIRLTVPVSSLRGVSGPAKKEEASASRTQAASIAAQKAQTVSGELKLIAQRVEQALENLDKYIDEAYAAGLPQVRIIHGHGTGALRMAVHNFLRNHPLVESYRLGEQSEGGAGATVVKLKQ